jgi:hypothetical protein
MFLWIIALLLFASLGIVGFYQGALRMAVSTVGLFVAALLAMPLAGVFALILNVFGMEHPIPISFLAPFIAFVLVLIGFKSVGMATHKKVDGYMKYKASDTVRLLFERMNSRVGILAGLCNAFIYFILISAVLYTVGYFSAQAAVSEKDTMVWRIFTRLAKDLQSTGVDKAVAGYVPAKENYFDAADVLALIFRNPVIQDRLSDYPPFLLYSEDARFKALGDDKKFQEDWIKGPSLAEFMAHEQIKRVIEDVPFYTNAVATLGGNYKDLKIYLETGKSPKYDEEQILGRWTFNFSQSFNVNRRKKPNMTRQEQTNLRALLGQRRDTTIIAMPNHRLLLKSSKNTIDGSWDTGSGGGYTLSVTQGGQNLETQASIDEQSPDRKTLTMPLMGVSLVFNK